MPKLSLSALFNTFLCQPNLHGFFSNEVATCFPMTLAELAVAWVTFCFQSLPTIQEALSNVDSYGF